MKLTKITFDVLWLVKWIILCTLWYYSILPTTIIIALAIFSLSLEITLKFKKEENKLLKDEIGNRN